MIPTFDGRGVMDGSSTWNIMLVYGYSWGKEAIISLDGDEWE